MPKVLVGEDDPSITELYKLFLTMANHDVVVCATKNELTEQLATFKPDLLILDVGLSDADGREICKEIKRVNSTLKIILISAIPNLLEEYKICEADAAIAKPFSIKDILNHISTLLFIS